MAQGPRLADAWDIDRKMALAFGAWIEMRQHPAHREYTRRGCQHRHHAEASRDAP
jgi:hypothetical protein